MHIVVGGASGFLGAPLATFLRSRGHQVTSLVRRPPHGGDESQWDPHSGHVDHTLIQSCDAVINLSGAPISQWPRTAGRKREILASRVNATSTLAQAVAAAATPPALVSASGMSWYGTDRGTEPLTEASGTGTGFLAEVSRQWEDAALPAVDAGSRVSFVRTSLVLHADGGMLNLMLPAWKLGLGARLGDGRQHMSLISRNDWVRAVTHLVEHDDASGPFNVAMPNSATNAEFTRALARAVNRPAFLAAPAFAIKAALGGLSEDLLGSLKVLPSALERSGFKFEQPTLEQALASALA